MHKKKIYYPAFLLTGALYFVLVNPAKAPLIALLLPFVWIAVTLYVPIYYLLGKVFTAQEQRNKTILKKYRLWAGVISLMVTFLCLLCSLHQLTGRDLGISIGFAGVASWYLKKIEFTSPST